jgi:Spy/CpxP family protein refolding chaperone
MRLTSTRMFIPAVVIALAMAMSVVGAGAQGRRGGARGAIGRGVATAPDEQRTLLLLTALLDLNDSQRQQVGAVFDVAAAAAAPIAAQATAGKDDLFQAAKSGSGDDRITSLAEQQASRTSQLLVLQAQTFSKVWSLLTDEQKSKFDDSMYADIGTFLSNARPPVGPASTARPPVGPGSTGAPGPGGRGN